MTPESKQSVRSGCSDPRRNLQLRQFASSHLRKQSMQATYGSQRENSDVPDNWWSTGE